MSIQSTGLGKDERRSLTLIRKKALADELGIGTWTLDRWVKQGKFPPPIYPTDTSPACWRVKDIAAWIEKRRAKRRKAPTTRGKLWQEMDEEEQQRAKRRKQEESNDDAQ